MCVRTRFRATRWNGLAGNPAPEGRPSLAQRFSAGKSGKKDSSPGGTAEFSRTIFTAGSGAQTMQVPEPRLSCIFLPAAVQCHCSRGLPPPYSHQQFALNSCSVCATKGGLGRRPTICGVLFLDPSLHSTVKLLKSVDGVLARWDGIERCDQRGNPGS